MKPALRGTRPSAPQGRAAARGFSLVEALVALVLLGIGVLAMGALLSGTLRASRDAIDQAVADHLVRHKIAELRATPAPERRDGSDVVTLDGLSYEREWELRSVPGHPDLTEIRVIASWAAYQAALTQPLSQPVGQTLQNPLGTVTSTLRQRGRVQVREGSAFVGDP